MPRLCRICESNKIKKFGDIQTSGDRIFDVYECADCGCRFVYRLKDVFEDLHRNINSVYSCHSIITENVKRLFDNRDVSGLEDYLCKTAKFKFIIDEISSINPENKSILEVGCSNGYLAAYFILKGYNIIGADVSPSAIKKAKSNFGEHFILMDELPKSGTFDIIYHVGTIGVVDNPIKFTNNLLDILKPNGKLIFNAPNLAAARERKSVWLSSLPPDVITLFDSRFWEKYFGQSARVNITFEPYPSSIKRNLFEIVIKILKMTGYHVTKYSVTEFGMFITMTKS
jgi:SAM-dependent methyltransferase